MILHFDITSQPAQGDTPSCAPGMRTGRQMASSAFWRTPQGQPELGLGFGRRSITDFFPASPFDDGKLAEKSFGRPFSADERSTSVLLGALAPSIPNHWISCRTVTTLINMNKLKLTFLLQGLRVAEVAGLAHTLCSLHQSCEAALSADVYLRNVMADLKGLSDRILDADLRRAPHEMRQRLGQPQERI